MLNFEPVFKEPVESWIVAIEEIIHEAITGADRVKVAGVLSEVYAAGRKAGYTAGHQRGYQEADSRHRYPDTSGL